MKKDRDIVLFRIDRKVGALVLGALAVVFGGFALAQELTLTTSYPVPSGIYTQLITTGNSGAGSVDTIFNRTAGNTLLVPATNAGGSVGIGTSAPAAKLDVNGAVQASGVVGVGAFAADPAGSNGQIYYNNGATPGFKGRVNGVWTKLGGGFDPTTCTTAVHLGDGAVACPAGTHAISGGCEDPGGVCSGANDIVTNGLNPPPTNGSSLSTYTGYVCYWHLGCGTHVVYAVCCP